MKYFSEILNQTFDTEFECKKAENEFLIAQRNVNEARTESMQSFVDKVKDIDEQIAKARVDWSNEYAELKEELDNAMKEVQCIIDDVNTYIDECDQACADITNEAIDKLKDASEKALENLDALEEKRADIIAECIKKFGKYEDDNCNIEVTEFTTDDFDDYDDESEDDEDESDDYEPSFTPYVDLFKSIFG